MKDKTTEEKGEKKKMKTYLSVTLSIICLLLSSAAEADQKSYVWTVEYLTLPKGGFEVEYSLTVKRADFNRSGTTGYEHQVEIEYGITDHWDVAMYQVADQAAGESLDYAGMKIESRYRFGERGRYIVDPLLYLEYKIDVHDEDAIEAKLVLAKDIGNLNIAYNQIIEAELGRSGEVEHEYATAVSYAVHHAVRIGVESKGSYSEREYAIGPTIAWVQGRFWATIGAVFGLNSRTDDMHLRLIVGIPF